MGVERTLFVYPVIQSGGSIKIELKDIKQKFMALYTRQKISTTISVERTDIPSRVLCVWFAIDLLLKCFQVIFKTLRDKEHVVFVGGFSSKF